MKEESKKTYKKPEFARVKLVPEEAILGECKTDLQTGPDTTPCTLGTDPCSQSTS